MDRQNGEKMDKSLLKFEKALKQMARKGQIDLPVDDKLAETILSDLEPVELTKNEMRKLTMDLRKAHQNKAIEQARALLPRVKCPFGRYIRSLRCEAQLSVGEIARRLKIESSYLESIEVDFENPMEIPREKIVDIMELFRIFLSEFAKTVEESLMVVQARTGRIKAVARSSSQIGSEERGIGVSHAVDATLVEIAKKKGKVPRNSTQVSDEYLRGIKEELIKRNRADLLV